MTRRTALVLVLALASCSQASPSPGPTASTPTASVTPSATATAVPTASVACTDVEACSVWVVPDVVQAQASGGLVVVRDADDRIAAIDATTGERRWDVAATGPDLGFVGRFDDTIVILVRGQSQTPDADADADADVTLVGLHASDGATRWERVVAGVGFGDDSALVVGDALGTLARLDPATGDPMWQVDLPGADTSFVRVFADHALLPSGEQQEQQVFVALADGTAVVRVPGDDDVDLFGLVGGTAIGTVISSSGQAGAIVAYDVVDGAERWRQEVVGGGFPILAADRVVVPLAAGGAVGIDPEDGSAAWQLFSGHVLARHGFVTTPSDVRRLLVTSDGDTEGVGVVDVATGDLVWQRRGDADVQQAIVEDDLVGLRGVAGYELADGATGEVLLRVPAPDEVMDGQPAIVLTGGRLVRLRTTS